MAPPRGVEQNAWHEAGARKLGRKWGLPAE